MSVESALDYAARFRIDLKVCVLSALVYADPSGSPVLHSISSRTAMATASDGWLRALLMLPLHARVQQAWPGC